MSLLLLESIDTTVLMNVFLIMTPHIQQGPTYCSEEVLSRNNLSMNDIGVFEIHEAFAGQILVQSKGHEFPKVCR